MDASLNGEAALETQSVKAAVKSHSIDASPTSYGIDASLKRRARLLMRKSSIPRETRALIRYALGIKDPYLAQVVRRVEARGMTIEWLYVE